MVVKTPSLVEVGLFRLANVKVCHAKFRKICDLFVVDAGVSFFCNFPTAIIVFFLLCFMLSKAHFNSIHYITQMTFKDFQTLPKNHNIARALKKINTFSAEKNGGKPKPLFSFVNFSRWLNPSDNRPGIFPTKTQRS